MYRAQVSPNPHSVLDLIELTIVVNLSRTDRMWGPVFDVHNHQYYINICTQEHRNNTCYDGDHQAILTYACQVTNAGYGEDIGDVVGFQTYHGMRSVARTHTHLSTTDMYLNSACALQMIPSEEL